MPKGYQLQFQFLIFAFLIFVLAKKKGQNWQLFLFLLVNSYPFFLFRTLSFGWILYKKRNKMVWLIHRTMGILKCPIPAQYYILKLHVQVYTIKGFRSYCPTNSLRPPPLPIPQCYVPAYIIIAKYCRMRLYESLLKILINFTCSSFIFHIYIKYLYQQIVLHYNINYNLKKDYIYIREGPKLAP